MPPTHMLAHHRGGQRRPTSGGHATPTHTPNSNLNLNLHPTLATYPPGRHCQGVKANKAAWPNAKAFHGRDYSFELRE